MHKVLVLNVILCNEYVLASNFDAVPLDSERSLTREWIDVVDD